VAYYQTGPDNEARVVCDDNEGSTDGYFCNASAVNTHIVDLPRTAYFLAKIGCMPKCNLARFRVAGIDQVIAPLLISAAQDLRDTGVITNDEYNNLSLAYGSGWPFHHHHIHLSFNWWSQGYFAPITKPQVGCGFRMQGDGDLETYIGTLDSTK